MLYFLLWFRNLQSHSLLLLSNPSLWGFPLFCCFTSALIWGLVNFFLKTPVILGWWLIHSKLLPSLYTLIPCFFTTNTCNKLTQVAFMHALVLCTDNYYLFVEISRQMWLNPIPLLVVYLFLIPVSQWSWFRVIWSFDNFGWSVGKQLGKGQKRPILANPVIPFPRWVWLVQL